MLMNFWLAIKYVIHNVLPMCWEQFAKTEANWASMEQLEEVADSEGPGQINTAKVEAAHEWLNIDDDGPEALKNILDCEELSEGNEKVEDRTFHQADDTTYCYRRVCEASHPLPSSLHMQMAMFKCQSRNCLMHGQRHLFRMSDSGKRSIPSSTSSVATVESRCTSRSVYSA